MSKRLIATLGLPGSGKSTWAKEQIDANPPGTVVRINKDDLRSMMHNGHWAGNKTERQILLAQESIISVTFCDPRATTVIVDDTNFEHLDRLRAIAEGEGAEFEVKDFTDVPVKVCIERDLKRANSVGHKVINKMHMRYIAKKYEPPTFDHSLPLAILVDIDGTLAHMAGRSPYDYSQVFSDKPDEIVCGILLAEIDEGTRIIVMSGRPEAYNEKSGQRFDVRNETEAWLVHYNIPYDELHMRAEGDGRDDAIVKSELFDAHIAGRYNVKYVLDDRDRVVAMWRQRGLKTFQVEDGDF